jgi:hypothetical protein
MVSYDIHYALRLCQERNLTEACVQLSALLGLWESAVDLALSIDVKLATQTASLPQNDPELRKKLWLKIGKLHLGLRHWFSAHIFFSSCLFMNMISIIDVERNLSSCPLTFHLMTKAFFSSLASQNSPLVSLSTLSLLCFLSSPLQLSILCLISLDVTTRVGRLMTKPSPFIYCLS